MSAAEFAKVKQALAPIVAQSIAEVDKKGLPGKTFYSDYTR